MQVSTSIIIARPIKDVWRVITDIEHAVSRISSIQVIEVLARPSHGFVGFKWKETRVMFGKEASEIMWVTDCEENKWYATRAESHGSVYISKLAVKPKGKDTELIMSFKGESQTWFARIFSNLMGVWIKGSIKKELDKDLQDIKHYLEGL